MACHHPWVGIMIAGIHGLDGRDPLLQCLGDLSVCTFGISRAGTGAGTAGETTGCYARVAGSCGEDIGLCG